MLASSVKRALLRKDPTFSEAEVGFRGFRELLLHLADRNVIELTEGSAKGDPEVVLATVDLAAPTLWPWVGNWRARIDREAPAWSPR